MTYTQTIEYLYSKAPLFKDAGGKAYKEGLENSILIDKMTGRPHRLFKSVHVAGTNGKGSVSHTIASILQASGLKVGLYTSPHLVDFRERIRINGQPIDQRFVIDFIDHNKEMIEHIRPSFFEITTAMAFSYFAEKRVDIAIIEVGLGGRLDCTNIISPILSVITNIGLEHTQFLGDTLEKIAAEKGGIIKPNIPVVIGSHTVETEPIFKEIAANQGAPILFAENNNMVLSEIEHHIDYVKYSTKYIPVLGSQLSGFAQRENVNTILNAIEKLRELGLTISDSNIVDGFARVIENTGLRGRWQTISTSPRIICDTGHNSYGIKYIADQLKHYIRSHEFNHIRIVFGMMSDKDIESSLSLMPIEATYYFTQASTPRSATSSSIYEIAKSLGYKGSTYSTVSHAIAAAKSEASTNDLIFVGGSTFIVADLLTMADFYIQ